MQHDTDEDRDEDRWQGPSGFAEFARGSHVVPADLASFRADRRSIDAAELRVSRWRTSAVAGSTTPAPPGSRRLRVDVVIAGTLRYALGERTFVGEPGSVHLMTDAEPVRFAIPGDAELIRIELPLAEVPRRLHPPADRLGRRPPSKLLDGLASLAQEVLDRPGGRNDARLAHAIRDLVLSTLEEATGMAPGRDARQLILAHVDLHLADPRLGPARIAADFGRSVRWVHQVFDVDGTTLARHIRQRRTDEAAARLRSASGTTPIAALAEQVGFAGRDQLTRAFRARYGVTPLEFAQTVRAGGAAPRPLPEVRSASGGAPTGG